MTIPLCPTFHPSSLRAGWVEGRVWRYFGGNAFVLHARIAQRTPSLALEIPPGLDFDHELGLVVEWTAWIPLRERTFGLHIKVHGKSAATMNVDGDLVLGLTESGAGPIEDRSLAIPMCAGWHRIVVDDAVVGGSLIEIAAIDQGGQILALTPHMAPRSPVRVTSADWHGHGSFTSFS